MKKRGVLCLCTVACMQLLAYSDTVVLKSGKTLEGKIIEKTDTYIKVSTDMIPSGLTYYLDDIDRVESDGGSFPLPNDAAVIPFPKEEKQEPMPAGQASSGASTDEEAQAPVDQDLLPFKLGVQKVGASILDFKFPGSGDSLYAFNLGDWQGKRSEGEDKLILKLYDKKKKLIEKAESICAPKNMKSFGSIAFSTKKGSLDSVAYFSVVLVQCLQADSTLDESKPEVQFARSVETAIKESKEAYFALYLKPPSKDLAAMEEFIYQSLRAMLAGGGRVISVNPMEGAQAEKLKSVCPRPYEMSIEQKAMGGTTTLSLPIGKVGNNWRILSNDE